MATFRIREVHDCEHRDAKRVRESLTQAGSCFLTHAKWGCESGDHSASLEVEAASEDEVRLMIPPVLRRRATIIRVA